MVLLLDQEYDGSHKSSSCRLIERLARCCALANPPVSHLSHVSTCLLPFGRSKKSREREREEYIVYRSREKDISSQTGVCCLHTGVHDVTWYIHR